MKVALSALVVHGAAINGTHVPTDWSAGGGTGLNPFQDAMALEFCG